MSAGPRRILIVDDDEQLRRLIARLLERSGYDCALAGDADDARGRLAEEEFALIICDVRMPREPGFLLVRQALADSPDTAAVMMTGHDYPAIADLAKVAGATSLVRKPFKLDDLLRSVEQAGVPRAVRGSRQRPLKNVRSRGV